MQRSEGRSTAQMRPVTITRRYLKHAHGSCLFELGDTKVLCAATFADTVAGWRRGSGLGWVTAEYSLLPASTHTRTRREVASGAPSGRTHEIQRLIGRSLRTVIDLGGLGGEHTLNVDCDVIQADGGTRTAAITGAFIAVHDALTTWREAGKIADLPVLDYVAATSVGDRGRRGVPRSRLPRGQRRRGGHERGLRRQGALHRGTGHRRAHAVRPCSPRRAARPGGRRHGRLVELQRRVIAEDIEVFSERG